MCLPMWTMDCQHLLYLGVRQRRGIQAAQTCWAGICTSQAPEVPEQSTSKPPSSQPSCIPFSGTLSRFYVPSNRSHSHPWLKVCCWDPTSDRGASPGLHAPDILICRNRSPWRPALSEHKHLAVSSPFPGRRCGEGPRGGAHSGEAPSDPQHQGRCLPLQTAGGLREDRKDEGQGLHCPSESSPRPPAPGSPQSPRGHLRLPGPPQASRTQTEAGGPAGRERRRPGSPAPGWPSSQPGPPPSSEGGRVRRGRPPSALGQGTRAAVSELLQPARGSALRTRTRARRGLPNTAPASRRPPESR